MIETELCVYGATSGGVAAAVQFHRLGRRAVLLAFDSHLGGLTSGGLGATDIGNKAAVGGISREFYRRLGAYYSARKIAIPQRGQQKIEGGDAGKWDSGPTEAWVFEPSVAEGIMRELVSEAGVEVLYNQRLVGVQKSGNRIAQIVMEDGTIVRARMFIDASYEGDLLAIAGVSYHVGREANGVYDETLNGVHFGHPNHNFNRFVDPYVEAGRPGSGLLKGVFAGDGGRQGEGDHRIQAYNFRMCLTERADIRVKFPRPASYDAGRYELLRRYIAAGVHDALNLTVNMPNGKTDTNNFGGFSSDNIGMNYGWADGLISATPSGVRVGGRTLAGEEPLSGVALYELREQVFQDHVAYQAGLYWFLGNDPRLPQGVRDDANRFGLAGDEFVESSHWPHQLYVREARRMISEYVMTEHNCVGRFAIEDAVGMAAYTMDSHNCNRVVRAGRAINEEVGRFLPYPISYRSIVPRESECANLLVPVCLSSSHIAYGSIRMEPVFMILGQSAATAAALAIDGGSSVQGISYAALQGQLRKDGQVLEWREVPKFGTATLTA